MNLKFHLLSRIALIAIISWVATAFYVLYQADQASKRSVRVTAESVGRQLEVQLLRIDTGFDRPGQFPDLDLWKETRALSGVCVRFTAADTNFTQGICHGTELPAEIWPSSFEKMYHTMFNPVLEISRPIVFKNQLYGSISVSPSLDKALAQAWESVRAVMKFATLTVLAVCLLVYMTISRALRPAQVIVGGLEQMQQGDLTTRLPTFELNEWQRTGVAINALAETQQQLLSERSKLALKLMTVQEDERQFMARELHDELGQCLAAVSAIAASIAHTAIQECPTLVAEAENIGRINQRIMETVRTLLVRLRPAEIDKLGLSASLQGLITEWNGQRGGKTHYQLVIDDNCDDLSEPLPVTVFRIVQECLTNIAKHSTATQAKITLKIAPAMITLMIEDNGTVDQLPFADNPGIGLLGIRERVTALGGQLSLNIAKPAGLIVHVLLPTEPGAGVQT